MFGNYLPPGHLFVGPCVCKFLVLNFCYKSDITVENKQTKGIESGTINIWKVLTNQLTHFGSSDIKDSRKTHGCSQLFLKIYVMV